MSDKRPAAKQLLSEVARHHPVRGIGVRRAPRATRGSLPSAAGVYCGQPLQFDYVAEATMESDRITAHPRRRRDTGRAAPAWRPGTRVLEIATLHRARAQRTNLEAP